MGGMRRPKKWVVALLVIGGTLVGVGLLVGFWTGIGPYDLPPKSRQLEDVIAVSKSLGLPMTQEELVGEVPPDDQNAALLVLPAILKIPSATSELSAILHGASPSDRKRAIETIEAQSELLDTIANGLKVRPQWYVARDYELGPMVQYPEYKAARDTARFFALRGAIRAQAGQNELAIRDFLSARDLARRMDKDPSILALLVANVCDATALRQVEWMADTWRGNSVALSQLEDAMLGSNLRLDATAALRGEFYFSLAITRNFAALGGFDFLANISETNYAPTIDPKKLKRTGLPEGMLERATMANIAEVWNQVFKARKTSTTPWRGWGEIADRRLAEMEARIRASEVLARILLVEYSLADDTLQNHDVGQGIAIAFVRCMRYRAEHKRWPKDLGEVGSDFSDPFNDNLSIKAKFGPNELRVWSIGRDRVDDGGKIRVEGEKGEDLVFVWPPSLRPVPR